MKSHAISRVLKVYDVLVLVAAIVLVAAPPAHLGTFAALVTSATASDAGLLGARGHGTGIVHDLLGMQVSLQALLLVGAFLAFWHFVCSALGLYSPERLGRSGLRVVVKFAVLAMLGVATVWAASPLIDFFSGSVSGFAAAILLAAGMSLVARYVVKAIVRHNSRYSKALRHVVIVGTNRRAIEFARWIEGNRWSGLKLVGFVDQGWAGELEFRESGYKVVCDFNGFQDFLKDQVVDDVVICTPLKSLYDISARVFAQCEQQGITVRFRSDPVSPIIGRSLIDEFGGQPVLTVDSTPPQRASRVVKRLVDIIGSATMLVLLAPVMAVIAIAVSLSSKGPVFFTQERVGYNKRRFRLFKFRTMVVDAEQRLASLESMNEVSGPVFKIKRDPRVTGIGRFLRKSSLDELPQLINVLKGDMSLVGPRPLAVRDYRGITEDWQRRRLSVMPGITCLWQVMGRSSIPFERWMELDLEYIDNWSLLLDLKICLQTVPAVVLGRGAA